MKSVSQLDASAPSNSIPPKLSHEQVALRAFSKWLARGCPSGDGDADWYEALKELEHEHHQSQKATPRNQELFARWSVPTFQQATPWWAVYGKVHERDGIPERFF